MKRPLHTWLLFSFCLAVVFSAMGWVTVRVLRLERLNAEAQRQAALEETVRLALWRMDSAASAFIIQESARPYHDYFAFNPASRVFPSTVKNLAADDLVPSPLLAQSPSNILVYFNGLVAAAPPRTEANDSAPSLTSPQVPTGELRNWAATNFGIASLLDNNRSNLNALAAAVSLEEIHKAIDRPAPEITLPRAPPNPPANRPSQNLDIQQQAAEPPAQWIAQSGNDADSSWTRQQKLNLEEFAARQDQSQRAQQQIRGNKATFYNAGNVGKTAPARQDGTSARQAKPSPAPAPAVLAAGKVEEDIMRPAWIRDVLVLARRVRVDGETYVQGAWINWPHLRKELLAQIADLFPSAALAPAVPEDRARPSRLMAALPLRLVPGEPAVAPAILPSPLAAPLAIAWACVVLAALAVAVLLAGAVSLSERRGAFVSAVTHELRTPLTTFRMYSEMLAEGMVPDEARRRDYLRTLCSEGNRLSHLVENVLSFARLERGRARKHMETLSLRGLVERVRDRLAQHAERCGMTLAVEDPEGSPDTEIATDLSAVDQILFNLVDNACKYAAGAADKRIHLETRARPGRIAIRIRDHGPGITRQDARRLFQPFRKSAKHAAESAPGVGLGLALSRQLARRMGGDLFLDPAVTDGACLELVLRG